MTQPGAFDVFPASSREEATATETGFPDLGRSVADRVAVDRSLSRDRGCHGRSPGLASGVANHGLALTASDTRTQFYLDSKENTATVSLARLDLASAGLLTIGPPGPQGPGVSRARKDCQDHQARRVPLDLPGLRALHVRLPAPGGTASLGLTAPHSRGLSHFSRCSARRARPYRSGARKRRQLSLSPSCS